VKNAEHTGHYFVPFSPPSPQREVLPRRVPRSTATSSASSSSVLHGKTVVVYVDSGPLAADQFTALLAKADQILKTLRFPA